LGEKSDLINENKKFRNVILRYEKQFLDYYKIQQENEYLRSILPLVSEQNIDTVSVVPCFSPPSAYLTLFFRSSSVANRINLGNIVFSTQGVVGQVVDIKRISNEEIEVIVMLITNIQSRIPVVSAKSHKHAILCGQNSKFFAVKYVKSIENDNDVAFIEEAKDFIDGEILEFSEGDMKIPVAKIVMQKDDTLAKWVVDSPTHYVTVAVNCKFNF
jgi:cell shape-determining protein MreC